MRLPNIFTAVSNVCAGSLIAGNGQVLWDKIIPASVASALLYAGGVAFNAYCDRKSDALTRPNRPVPSGIIKPTLALILSIIFLILGSAAGFLVSASAGIICLAIAISAVLYDTLKSSFPPAIILMALCRGLNWYLGLMTADKIDTWLLLIPAGVFLYTISLTALSRWEDKIPSIKQLVKIGIIAIPVIDGMIVMTFGFIWPGILVAALVIPVIILGKIFEIT